MKVKLVVFAAVLATCAAIVASTAPAARFVSYWKTPSEAAYCRVLYSPVRLTCWTPNDGFTITLYTTRASEHFYWRGHRDFFADVPVFPFGYRWAWSGGTFRCDSARDGLTCKNAAGHGWWLGRYHGYRTF